MGNKKLIFSTGGTLKIFKKNVSKFTMIINFALSVSFCSSLVSLSCSTILNGDLFVLFFPHLYCEPSKYLLGKKNTFADAGKLLRKTSK